MRGLDSSLFGQFSSWESTKWQSTYTKQIYFLRYMAKKKQDMKSLAKLGGVATLEKYGKDHYRKMIEKRWKNEKKKPKKK